MDYRYNSDVMATFNDDNRREDLFEVTTDCGDTTLCYAATEEAAKRIIKALKLLDGCKAVIDIVEGRV